MTSSTKNVKLGVCRVIYDSVDLGYTQGGVEVIVATNTHEVMIDQFGKTPINEYIQGRTCTVKVPLAETTLQNLVKIMPGATLVSAGRQATDLITMTGTPVVGSSIQIGATTFGCVASGGAANTFVRSGGQPATVVNLVNAINAAAIGVTASAPPDGSSVLLTATDMGVAGNSIAVTIPTTVPFNGTAATPTLLGGVDATIAKVDVSVGVGIDLLSIAKLLRLHPIAKADSDLSDDFNIPLAATAGELSFAYKLDAERIYNCEFKAYPDPVTNKLFTVGNPAASS